MLPSLDAQARACSLRHKHGYAPGSQMKPFPAPLFREYRRQDAGASPMDGFMRLPEEGSGEWRGLSKILPSLHTPLMQYA